MESGYYIWSYYAVRAETAACIVVRCVLAAEKSGAGGKTFYNGQQNNTINGSNKTR
jgi:hypothetical protein